MNAQSQRRRVTVGAPRSRWWLAAVLAGSVTTVAAVVLVGRPGGVDPDRTPSPGSSGSLTSTTRPPITVQPDLQEPGESQFGEGPVHVSPTERPATDMGTSPGGPTPPSSPASS